jgi:hypothetical protein
MRTLVGVFMRSVAVLFFAALVALSHPVAAGDGVFGLRTGIMPAGDGVTSAELVLAQPTRASRLTLTATSVEPDGWVDRSDRGATAFTARLRAGYQATPAIQPFVELEVLQRQGASRQGGSATAAEASYAWRAGMRFEQGVSGEFAVGYMGSLSGNAGSGALGAFAVNGSLAWAPTPLTMVALTASTVLAPPDDSARVLYRAGVSATWQINHFHQVRAGYRHEWRDDADASSKDQSDAMLLEFRLQR